jgi:hypothetical protein
MNIKSYQDLVAWQKEEFVQSVGHARGSLFEVETQLIA